MADPARQMSPEMRAFLEQFAVSENHPGDFRWAAEEVIRRAMANPDIIRRESRSNAVPLIVPESPAVVEQVESPPESETITDSADLVDTHEEDVSEEDSLPPAHPSVEGTPRAPRANAKVEAPPGLKKTKPSSITINGETTATKSWRQAFLVLVEYTLREGREDAIPFSWIKEEEDRTVSPLSDGRFIYSNFSGEQLVPRMMKLVRALGATATATIRSDEEPTRVIHL